MYITTTTTSTLNEMITSDEFNHNNNNNNNNNSASMTNLHMDSKMITKKISMCFGCGGQITDQYILKVAPDLEWHAKCLKCFECGQYLDENCTCFVRNGKTYCKLDYFRLFSKKCFKCKDSFNKNDLVMRANNRIYHVDCFRCCMCNKQLAPGEEFALKEDGLLCKVDNDQFEKHQQQQQQQQQQHPTSIAAPNQPPLVISNNPTAVLPTANSTSCQNITNLQTNNNNHTNANGNAKNMLLKGDSGDLANAPIEYEDTQNQCLSPHLMGHHHMSAHNSRLAAGQQAMSMHGNGPNAARLMTTNGNSNSSTASSASSSCSSSSSTPNSTSAGNAAPTQGVHSHAHAHPQHAHHGHGNGGAGGASGGHHHAHRKDKTTRVRTVLNEKQLHTLRTCYGANPRPDALMKEQLVEMTGLSPRVIRVWFQNKRCKDKKKTILIKQMQEQQKNRQTIGNGIPMVATSPVCNDINSLGPGSQVEMQASATAYQTSSLAWGKINDYSSLNELCQMGSMPNVSGMTGTGAGAYDQMMSFGSDEEDCFDQLSDQGGDDSVSSVGGLDDTRIQQL